MISSIYNVSVTSYNMYMIVHKSGPKRGNGNGEGEVGGGVVLVRDSHHCNHHL